MSSWDRLGTVPPKELVEARLHLHWATQPVSAAAYALVPEEPDESHAALTWAAEKKWLVTSSMPGGPPQRAALALDGLRLVVADDALEEIDSVALEGKTLTDGLDWLGGKLDAPLTLPTYDLAENDLQRGARFHYDAEPVDEIARWYDTAFSTLAALDRGDVRTWPHHFDMAILEALGDGRSIGVGMSPGDASYAEPYWYVLPWPKPAGDFPPLPHGSWHTEGFVSAVLTASELVGPPDGKERKARLDAFIDAAVAGARALVARAEGASS